MVNNILLVAAVISSLAILLAFFRFLKGPGIVDRLLSFDVMTIASIATIVLVAHFANRFIYLDISLVYALLSFLGIIIIARYIERGL
jgi:multicomponent Na+:H+ antiporter subunit F